MAKKKTASDPSAVKQVVNARVVRRLLNPELPPKPISRLGWTKIGSDIQLDVGFVDFPEVNEAVVAARAKHRGQGKTETGVEVTTYITDRFRVSVNDVLRIYEELTKLVNELRREGLLPPDRVQTH